MLTISSIDGRIRGGLPCPPRAPPAAAAPVYRRFCVRAVAVLAPCAVLRFTRARSGYSAVPCIEQARPWLALCGDHRCSGRVALASASNDGVRVVSFRTAVRFICQMLGDFGFPSPFVYQGWARGLGAREPSRAPASAFRVRRVRQWRPRPRALSAFIAPMADFRMYSVRCKMMHKNGTFSFLLRPLFHFCTSFHNIRMPVPPFCGGLPPAPPRGGSAPTPPVCFSWFVWAQPTFSVKKT